MPHAHAKKKRNKKGEPRARMAHAHPDTNASKLKVLDDLMAVYGPYVQQCIDVMLARHIVTLDKKDTAVVRATFPASPMTSQLQKCARFQAIGIVKSWGSDVYRRTLCRYIRSLPSPTTRKVPAVTKGPSLVRVTDDERSQLYTIGKHGLRKGGPFGKHTIEQRMVDLYWSWVWDEDVTGKRPSFGNGGMMLTEMCCTHGASDNPDGLSGWWVTLSTLKYRKLVTIPLAPHPSLDGKTPLAKTVLIRKRPDGQWSFQFTEYVPPPLAPAEDAKRVGVDVGKRVLLATSTNRKYGEMFSPRFDRLFVAVQKTRANRQRQGLQKDSKRLRLMEQRLSGMTKTAVGRAVNQCIADHPGAQFVLEDLNLTGARGSKRFAYMEAKRSFMRKVVPILVNPAYTSQECRRCHYVSRRNRNGGKFHCRGCGRISHADCVGGGNLVGRSYDQQITVETEVSAVEAILRTRYVALRNRVPTDSAGDRASRRTTVVPDAYCRARPSGAAGHSVEQGMGQRPRA